MFKNFSRIWLIPIVLILGVGFYFLPPVHDRLAGRIDDLRAQIKYYLNPPDQAVFIPAQSQQDAIKSIVSATMQAYTLSQTPSGASKPTATNATSSSTLTSPNSTSTPEPLPAAVSLPGVIYLDQHGGWNLCGPSNLTMALKFWGWSGTREDVIKVIKPGINDPKLDFITRGKPDKNVMPYEMVDFVQNDTDYHAFFRYGGEINLLKKLIASGFPVLIEKGVYEKDASGVVSWLGHYAFVTGYDDGQGVFIYQDTYPPEGVNGNNRQITYADFRTGWRAFDYLFIVVYPPEHEQDVFNILGSWGDTGWANQHALDLANQDINTLSGLDLFFAWFNKGTSDVQLLQYNDAAVAYDQAFTLYPVLPIAKKDRPYRLLWYQTGPYWAYYYTVRYQDVINLANTTLSTVLGGPTLEESLYWRGMAEEALGDMNSAVADFKQANHLNPKMTVIIQKLQSLGITPETPVQ
jgi:tetratricopeptide (TPR) repeat protein